MNNEKEERIPPMDYISKCFQQQIKNVYIDYMSQISEDGIQFAAAIIYAQYLGMRIIGPIPPWVRRLVTYPLMAPDELLHGVRWILETKKLKLSDDGKVTPL